MHTTPPRIALLLPAAPHQALGEKLLHELLDQGLSPIVFHLALPGPTPGPLYRIYRALDNRLFAARAAKPGAPRAPRAESTIALSGPDWPAKLLQTLQDASAELLITAGRLALPEAVLAALPLGCLSLDHLDFASGDAPEAFHALAQGKPTWEPRLLWLQAGRPPRILYRSPSAVFPRSLEQTRGPACAKALHFVPRMLRAYQAQGLAAWEKRAEPASHLPAAHFPDTWAMGRFLATLGVRHLRAAATTIQSQPQWFVAVRHGVNDPMHLEGMTALQAPDARGWADPFPIEYEGKRYLFVEEIDPVTAVGHIAVMVEQPDGRFTPPQTVLTEPHHLSYPFVFAWDGAMYMIPETGQAGAVSLYKARAFPEQWEKVATLLDHVRAVDATVFEHDGRWWLMVNVRPEGESSWDEMSLFYADTPYGPYQPHPDNPVVSDVSRARPAGRVFRQDGQLYRPAQDCAGQYGRALVINAITALSPTDYAEHVVIRHEATLLPGSDSLHTYNGLPGLEVVDGRRHISRWCRNRPDGR